MMLVLQNQSLSKIIGKCFRQWNEEHKEIFINYGGIGIHHKNKKQKAPNSNIYATGAAEFGGSSSSPPSLSPSSFSPPPPPTQAARRPFTAKGCSNALPRASLAVVRLCSRSNLCLP